MGTPTAQGTWPGIGRIGLYALGAMSPLIVSVILRLGPVPGAGYHGLLVELGRGSALVAFGMLVMQFVLSARSRWMELPFGFDMVIRFHKAMAVFAGILLVSHPILIALGKSGSDLLTSFDLPWYLLLGKAVLLVVLVNVALSLWRRKAHLGFQHWRAAHNVLGALLLAGGFTHSLMAGHDVAMPGLRMLWYAALGVALVVYAHHRVWRPVRARAHRYTVSEVRREAQTVWTLKLSPPAGRRCPEYIPGQFHFLTLHRPGRGLPQEEHHFSISSSPGEGEFLLSTIKESGDYTGTIGQTQPGDTVAIEGPYGRFSYRVSPGENDLVFIAAGIGITPVRAMLRDMADTGHEADVVLLYANRTEADIVFGDELEQIQAGSVPRLQVVHVLSRPDAAWTGEHGHIDRDMVVKCCGTDLAGKSFYISGPPAMSRALIRTLRKLGVPTSRIHAERFDL